MLDPVTGELRRGRIRPADRLTFRRFLAGFEGEQIDAALEATTGWRFIVEELRAVGAEVHLAEPAETRAARAQAACQDRPGRCSPPARADARRTRTRVLDPA